jgi:peptidoglycan/LPS O-acetylase OafA/YrhL
VKRFQELDALRGIAAVWVMLFHYTNKHTQLYGPPGRLPSVIVDGDAGVHLFFAISGFVILMTLQASRNRVDFLVSRFSRLYPAYWAAMLVSATVGLLAPLPGQQIAASQLAVNATMTQAYLYVAAIEPVYWSLAYELGFYAVMYALFLSGGLRHILPVGALWLGLALWHKASMQAWGIGVPHRLTILLVLPYAHLFVAGIALHEIWAGRRGPAVWALLIACAVAAPLIQGWHDATYMLVALPVFLLAVLGWLPMLRWGPLLWLGSISYTLYLTHNLLGQRLILFLEGKGLHPVASVIIAIACALLLAEAISRFVERPAMAAIRGAYRRRTAQRAV